MRNKGLHILIKPNPLQSVSCSPWGTITRAGICQGYGLCSLLPFVIKISPCSCGCQAPGEGSGAVGHTRNEEFRFWPYCRECHWYFHRSSGLTCCRMGHTCWWCHPLSEALEREVYSIILHLKTRGLALLFPVPVWVGGFFCSDPVWWQTVTSVKAAGSAPCSPQSIDVHWFICFFHCCLFSSPNVAVCSIILELKSKISEANYSGLLTQVARNHE